ncbi:MAG: Chorismate synthase [Chlamydiae bacterium]|nr:Chorismate synthase [Chlamydiota bacterium]
MASNSFGKIFRITTWGESHGRAIGVVIDGCPAGLEISEEEINQELARRAPGRATHTSPRKEPDLAEIYSGLFEGKTTGSPISIIIHNLDADPSKYEPIKGVLRPGHANYTYEKKYGLFDYRGGGRASARETACRVAAGAVAMKLLEQEGISCQATIAEIGGHVEKAEIERALTEVEKEGDSLGGVIAAEVSGLPVGLGEPIYYKIEAMLAQAMLSLPATKGFEMGEGFRAGKIRGSGQNDLFTQSEGRIRTRTNRAGGTLGGLTSGMPLTFKVAFKPTSTIQKSQESVTHSGEKVTLKLPKGSRHDPCVVFRALPVVEAMAALVLADALLLNRAAKI